MTPQKLLILVIAMTLAFIVSPRSFAQCTQDLQQTFSLSRYTYISINLSGATLYAEAEAIDENGNKIYGQVSQFLSVAQVENRLDLYLSNEDNPGYDAVVNALENKCVTFDGSEFQPLYSCEPDFPLFEYTKVDPIINLEHLSPEGTVWATFEESLIALDDSIAGPMTYLDYYAPGETSSYIHHETAFCGESDFSGRWLYTQTDATPFTYYQCIYAPLEFNDDIDEWEQLSEPEIPEYSSANTMRALQTLTNNQLAYIFSTNFKPEPTYFSSQISDINDDYEACDSNSAISNTSTPNYQPVDTSNPPLNTNINTGFENLQSSLNSTLSDGFSNLQTAIENIDTGEGGGGGIDCESTPNILACVDLTDSGTATVTDLATPTLEEPAFTGEGATTCPAIDPVPGLDWTQGNQFFCDGLSMSRPVVISICSLIALSIVWFGVVRV
tara:strand:+ start:49980 stop:51305 length:1326 start_codon:yes stop_codon:yes gene_type:complete